MGVSSLSEVDVDLWYVLTDTATDPPLLERYRRLLSPDESTRVGQFAFERDRHRWLVARALVRTVLAEYAGCDPRTLVFLHNAFGKPVLAEPAGLAISFNLSRTAGLVVCAVAGGHDVGVDVEDTGRRLEFAAVARRFFAPAEAAAIERTAPEEQSGAFFQFWTLKEAYIKAQGRGLSIPLDSFAITLSDNVPPVIRFTRNGGHDPRQWQFAQIRLEDRYQIALALRLPKTDHLKIRIRQTVPLERNDAGRILPFSPANRWPA